MQNMHTRTFNAKSVPKKLSSSTVFSQSSKHLLFFSLHMCTTLGRSGSFPPKLHINIYQTTYPTEEKSIIHWAIYQSRSRRLSTACHKVLTTSQWSSEWCMIFPSTHETSIYHQCHVWFVELFFSFLKKW